MSIIPNLTDGPFNVMNGISGKDLKDIDKIVVDVKDKDSLRNMARQSDVILNCVGPYLLYGGEEVVQACVQEGTHHLDLSGESQFLGMLKVFHDQGFISWQAYQLCILLSLENMQLKYNKDAEESGSYIVGCCG